MVRLRQIPARWYSNAHWLLTILSGLILSCHFLFGLLDSSVYEALGFSIISAGLAGLHVIYSLTLYWFGRRGSPVAACLISFVLASLPIGWLTHMTGGFNSWYFAGWLLLVGGVGMFGFYAVGSYSLATAIYFIYVIATPGAHHESLSGLHGDIGHPALSLVLTFAVATSSYYFWRSLFSQKDKSASVEIGKVLRAEQLKSEFLINSFTDGVVVFDTSGHIKLINPAGARMLGWKQEDAIDLDFHSVFRFFTQQGKDEIELNDIEHPFQAVFKTGQPFANAALTLATKEPDKRLIVSLSVSPIMANANEISGAVAVYRDVSTEKLQERQRSEFISTASHEMRTPIAAIEGYLSLTLNDKVCKIDTKARELLNKAHDSTQHLGDLFRDLLEASKSEEGRMESHPRVVELGDFIERIVEESRFSAQKKGLRLDFLVAAQTTRETGSVVRPLYYVYVDPDRMQEVITNLINNAIKFTSDGGITVGLRGESSYVQVSIKDTGVGIPEQDIPHIFQKFYRVDSSATRTIGGTGLGLFISRNIIELYKGQIWAESKLGEGSTFFINLPRLDVAKAEEMLKREAAEKTPLSDIVPEPTI